MYFQNYGNSGGGEDGGMLRRRCCVSSFSNCYFSDKVDQKWSKTFFQLSLFIVDFQKTE